MFETLIASGLCYFITPQGQVIELHTRCVDPSVPSHQPRYPAAELTYLEAYRRLHPDSVFTDAEVLFSGRASCGERATIPATSGSAATVSDRNEVELVTMLMQHWEASHSAAAAHLCPGLLNLQELD